MPKVTIYSEAQFKLSDILYLPGPLVGFYDPKNAPLKNFQIAKIEFGAPLIPAVGYGYCVLTGMAAGMLLTWQSCKEAAARKEFDVPDELPYSEKSMKFNCVRRAYHSTGEVYPQFLFLLLTGGLERPYYCTIAGWIWILGRFVTTKGYYSGNAVKRHFGCFYVIGKLMLMYATASFAYSKMHLGDIPMF